MSITQGHIACLRFLHLYGRIYVAKVVGQPLGSEDKGLAILPGNGTGTLEPTLFDPRRAKAPRRGAD
jgi:hypothetical protein